MADVAGELARLKGAGVRSFDVAWSYAVDAFPPRQMETGPTNVLFTEEEPVADFMRRRAQLEWDGLVVDDFREALGTLVST